MRPSLGYSTLYWANVDRKKAESQLKKVFLIDDEPEMEPIDFVDPDEEPPANEDIDKKAELMVAQSPINELSLKKPNQKEEANELEKLQDNSIRHRNDGFKRSHK